MTVIEGLTDDWRERRSSAEPERNLWRAVFLQALADALSFDSAACRWLFVDEVDAPAVLELAGLDIGYVRPRAKSLVVMMALAIARGRQPQWDSDSKKVTFRRPRLHARKAAIQFLRSSLGASVRFECDLPRDPHEREKMLAAAVRLSRDVAEMGALREAG